MRVVLRSLLLTLLSTQTKKPEYQAIKTIKISKCSRCQLENASKLRKRHLTLSVHLFFFFVTTELPGREDAGTIGYQEATQSTYLTSDILEMLN